MYAIWFLHICQALQCLTFLVSNTDGNEKILCEQRKFLEERLINGHMFSALCSPTPILAYVPCDHYNLGIVIP